MLYLISYDLRKPGRNYAPLYEALSALGARIRPLQSIWMLATTWSAVQIRDYLQKHIDPNDGLLVIKAGNEAAWTTIVDSGPFKQVVEAAT